MFISFKNPIEISKIIIAVIAITVLITALFLTDISDIKDTNGADDFSLSQISLNDIINNSVTSSEYFSSFKNSGNSSFVTDVYRDKDYDIIQYSAKKKSGTSVISATHTNKNAVTFRLDNKVVSGNCRIIVTVNNEYYDEFELNCSDEITLTDIANKTIYVIMGCESTDFELELHREIIQ